MFSGPDANAHFLNIKKAYDILSNPSERRTYDASRPRQARPRPPHRGDRVFTHTNNRQNPYSRPQKPTSHFRNSNNYHYTPPPDSYTRGFNGWREHDGKWEYKEQPEGEPVYKVSTDEINDSGAFLKQRQKYRLYYIVQNPTSGRNMFPHMETS